MKNLKDIEKRKIYNKSIILEKSSEGIKNSKSASSTLAPTEGNIMMEVFIKRNPNTPTGYELVDGNAVTPIVKSVVEKKTGILWLRLPANSTGRTLVNEAKVRATEGDYEVARTAKRSKVEASVAAPKSNRLIKDAEVYLNEDEYKVFKSLMAKIECNREAKALEDKIKALEEKKAELLKGGDKE